MYMLVKSLVYIQYSTKKVSPKKSQSWVFQWTDKALPTSPTVSLLGVLIGLDKEKDAMMSRCLDMKEVRCATWRVHKGTGQLVFIMDTYKATFSVVWQAGLRGLD